MATLYSDIFDLAQMDYSNYELDTLYSTSPTNYNLYMTGVLVRVLPSFPNCLSDLTDRNDTTQTFNIDLTESEQSILASLMAVQILKKEIFDIRQIRGMTQTGRDSTRHSEGNLLKEKRGLRVELEELVEQKMTVYGLKNEDWSTFYEATE